MPPKWESTDKNPALKEMSILLGDWEISGRHRLIPNPISGRISFSWFNGESFLIMRTDFNQSGPPNSTAVIGSDDSAEKLSVFYFDERGVSRIYDLKFKDGIWEMWRNFPGFSQRYKGRVKDNGNIIEGVWEISEDDINWNKDLEITYTRINER
ncbi:MAG TPA: hypothetical protein VHO03_01385 [Ignavibacteriales bacterium]|nr:hypothetical protein [Ignavibacteriales bacterium]